MKIPSVTLRSLVQSGRQRNFGKKTLAPKTINQRRYVDAIERYDMVFGIGPAGTGKTYLAVAMAVSAFLNKKVSRIILTRPAVEAGEKLGFLPGTLQEKIDPYLRPLYDALYDMVESERVEKLLERGTIEIAPIAFMRGRTLNDSFIIVDEAQNATQEQMKMILTRLGFNSKMVVTGDLTQIDLPSGRPKRAAERPRRPERHRRHQHDRVRRAGRRPALAGAAHRRAYDRYSEMTGAGRQLSLKLGDNGQDGAASDGPAEEATTRAPSPGRPGRLKRRPSHVPRRQHDYFSQHFPADLQTRPPGLRRTTREQLGGGRPFCCLIAGDAQLRRLNKQFLGKDYPTDVLSFPSGSPAGPLGDMAISLDRAREQASEQGHSLSTRGQDPDAARPAAPARPRS